MWRGASPCLAALHLIFLESLHFFEWWTCLHLDLYGHVRDDIIIGGMDVSDGAVGLRKQLLFGVIGHLRSVDFEERPVFSDEFLDLFAGRTAGRLEVFARLLQFR